MNQLNNNKILYKPLFKELCRNKQYLNELLIPIHNKNIWMQKNALSWKFVFQFNVKSYFYYINQNKDARVHKINENILNVCS